MSRPGSERHPLEDSIVAPMEADLTQIAWTARVGWDEPEDGDSTWLMILAALAALATVLVVAAAALLAGVALLAASLTERPDTDRPA